MEDGGFLETNNVGAIICCAGKDVTPYRYGSRAGGRVLQVVSIQICQQTEAFHVLRNCSR